MTWGGLRADTTIAMALVLPGDFPQTQLISTTYCIIIFSIWVQGLTLASLKKISFEKSLDSHLVSKFRRKATFQNKWSLYAHEVILLNLNLKMQS